MTTAELKKTANEVRKGIIKSTHAAKSGHPGGSLSAADVFTYLYFVELNVDPKNPKDENRDRFVLSKGHCAPALYATLAIKGFLKEDILIINSDGLTNLVPQEEIFKQAKKDIEQAPKELVKIANENGGYDNITVIIVKNI